MTYVVTDNCVSCKFTDCVEVCPVDCFYEAEDHLVIDPDECIDCSACVPACPVEAIFADDELPSDQESWLQRNADETLQLKGQGAEPIIEMKDPLPTAEARKSELGFE